MPQQIVEYSGYAIIGFVSVLVLVGALKGRSRGICRQVIRTITVAASLVISFLLTKALSTKLISFFENTTTEDLMLMIEQNLGTSASDNFALNLLSYVETGTLNYILAIPLSLIICPILFVTAFVIISGLMLIVHAILSMIFGFSKKRNSPMTRLLGSILGALQGVVVSAILLVPIVGLLATSQEVVDRMKTEAPDDETTITISESYDEYIAPFANDKVISLMAKFGDKLIYDKLTTVKIDGVEYKMTETVSTPFVKILSASSYLKEMDYMSLTEDNKKGIEAVISALDDSDYVSTLIAEILDSAATAYTEGAFVFETEGEAGELIGAAVGIFVDIDKDSLIETLNTLCEVYYILSDENVFHMLEENPEALTDILTKTDEEGKTIINKLTTILQSNPRTSALVTRLTKLSFTIMASKFEGSVEISEETYDSVKEGLNDLVAIDKESFDTDEEYVDAVSDSLDQTLTDNGIELDKDIVDKMAEFVVNENILETETGELTDEDISNIILSYYDAYLQSGMTLPDDLPIP